MQVAIIFILSMLSCFCMQGQPTGAIEQYHYIGGAEPNSIVPVAHIQNNKGWYGEARYNYDDVNTFSILGGKTFSFGNITTASVTPMVGVAFGNFNGATIGANVSVERNNFFFDTQSQYTHSFSNEHSSFLFNWCEVGYQPTDWLFGGLSLQHTQFPKGTALLEPGFLLGFNVKQISFPLYIFNTFNSNRFFILGVNWEWRQ